MRTRTNRVVFIHGLWIHAGAWQPWLDMFAERGYAVSAPGWPDDPDTVAATRDNADALNDIGIKPFAFGHSFGGLIAQELLAGGHAAAMSPT